MSKIEVFEPALCCATGVCGEDVDQQLVNFSADLDFIRSRGADIARYNLASEPQAFAANDSVAAFLRLSGSAGLPLVLVDGVTAMTGRYPDRIQLAIWAGLDALAPIGSDLGITAAASTSEGCCGGGGGASSCC
jgi:arsenite-transporting ATPase